MKLDIVMTSYYSCAYLNQNYATTKYWNPNLDIKWIVVQNTPEPELLIPHVFVIPGVERPVMDENWCGSYHHGLALNKGKEYIRDDTDCVLFLDPDFFILPKLDHIMKYMGENCLDIFGASYHFNKKNLDREFPCGFCMFFNSKTVNIEELDFEPGFGEFSDNGAWPDVGHKITRRLKDKTQYEVVIPVEGFKDSYLVNAHLNTTHNRLYKWQNKPFGIHCAMKIQFFKEKENFARLRRKTSYLMENIMKIREIDYPAYC